MNPLYYQIFNFVILAGGLTWLLRKALGTHYRKQKSEWEGRIQEAAAEYDAMKKEFDKAERSFKEIDKAIAETTELMKREIAFEKNRIESENKAFAEKLQKDCELRIKNDSEKAKVELQKEVWQSALTAARLALRTELKNSDNDWTSQIIEGDASGSTKAANVRGVAK